MPSHDLVECETHGASRPAFVCAHLCKRPGQKWFCHYPTKKNPTPDAWCAQCNDLFEQEGGWTERTKGQVDIKLLCQHCYDALRAESIPVLQAAVKPAWDALVGQCHQELHERQDRLMHDFELGSFKRYDYDMATKQMVFSNDGQPGRVAEIEVVGTLSHISGTWLWSWANFSLPTKVRTRMKQIRNLGERESFDFLTTSVWPADKYEAQNMAAIAAHVLKADGIYRVPGDSSDMYMTLSKLRRVN